MNKNKLIKRIKKILNKNKNKKQLNKNQNQNYKGDILLKMEKDYLLKPFPLKEFYEPIIPLHVYQTWKTKELPPIMKNFNNLLKEQNPEFQFHLYDDNDCREFISQHFDSDVVHAFDSLKPGAYKADLWRYCVLYINGGIYLDIKYYGINGFKLISLTEKEHYANDWTPKTKGLDINFEKGVYNAIMVTLPGNEILKKCIDRIVLHVKIKFYGINPLHPTGPFLLKEYFTNEERKEWNLNLYIRFHDCIRYDLYPILTYYKQYRNEQNKNLHIKHYDPLWREKNIYN